MITFIYNGKQYTTNNLENKLNKLGITKEQIQAQGNRDLGEIDNSIKKYYFIDKDTKHTLVSIKKNVNDIPGNWEMMYEK